MPEVDPSSVPLYQIIGAPLLALVQAETQAAKATASFIEQIGFEPTERTTDNEQNLHYGGIKTVTFTYQKTGVGGAETTFIVKIPVLSIIPIPALQIREAQIDFSVEINQVVQLEQKTGLNPPKESGQDSSLEDNIVVL